MKNDTPAAKNMNECHLKGDHFKKKIVWTNQHFFQGQIVIVLGGINSKRQRPATYIVFYKELGDYITPASYTQNQYPPWTKLIPDS